MSQYNSQLYPFCLRAVVKEKVWGGRKLADLLGKALPPDAAVGETWEAWEACTIENGPLAGQTLSGAIEKDPRTVLGSRVETPRFPLLFKFIDAQEDLSVQVHPNDAQAQAMERQPYGKTEAWYILHAEPGAKLIVGFREDCEADRIVAAIRENELVDLLAFLPVQRGDVVFMPAGTVHAIGKGIVLAEIQENSDITYRFYDWGRVGQGRDLHIAQSLEVAKFTCMTQPKIPSLVVKHASFVQTYLVACRYFAFERLELQSGRSRFSTGDKFNIVSVVDGAVSLFFGPDFRESVTAGRGQTMLLPAALGEYEIAPSGQSAQVLKAYVPELTHDVIEPLLTAGYDRAAIERLGGAVPEQNDVRTALQAT